MKNSLTKRLVTIVGVVLLLALTGYGLIMPGKELPEISMAAEVIPLHLPIPGFHHGIPNTLPTAILTTLILGGIALAYYLAVRKEKKTGEQSRFVLAVDAIYEVVYSFVEDVAGKKFAPQFFPLVGSFFFFILIANWLGLIPGMGSLWIKGEHHGEIVKIPLLRSPSADLNTTIGLGIISLVATQYFGLKLQGGKYLKKFFNFSAPPGAGGGLKPVLVFANGFAGILEMIAEVIKIFSFAFRLFGNVFAGEVLLMVISFLASFIAVIPFMGLELFVGLIQALIFAMLTLIFFRMAAHHH